MKIIIINFIDLMIVSFVDIVIGFINQVVCHPAMTIVINNVVMYPNISVVRFIAFSFIN